MPKIDLLPCPFCGETDLHLESFSGFGADVVICRGCLATFSQQEITCEEDLIKAWNTRASGWIPCSERMPERDGFYLAYYTFADGRHACDIVYFNVGAPISSSITHWRPLPEPPETEDKT